MADSVIMVVFISAKENIGGACVALAHTSQTWLRKLARKHPLGVPQMEEIMYCSVSTSARRDF